MEKKDWSWELYKLLIYVDVDCGEWELGFAIGSEGFDKVEEFIQQELDKAREEVLTELQEEFSEFGVPDDVRYTKPLFYINEIIEEKLSKLKQ